MSKKAIYPSFIIGGAPKSGTSSLYFWLSAHPQIIGSKIKEPFFFADEVNRFNKGLNCIENPFEDYAKLFENGEEGKQSFESTAHYLYYQNAIDGLQKLPVKPRIIFLLREPSAQLLSHYQMERYRTQSVKMELSEYVKQPYILKYTEYTKYLQMWFDGYGRDFVKVVLFEDMMRNKLRVIKEIAGFLEVDASFYDDFDFEHRNKSVKIKSSKLHKFGLAVQAKIPHQVQKVLLPLYLKMNSGDVPKPTDEEKAILAEFKKEKLVEVESLKLLLPELDFALWK